MKKSKKVVITTGGTAEPIDDVRYVTNFSTGKFGHKIARALANLDYQVEMLTARSSMWLSGHYGVSMIPFTSAESLRTEILRRENPDVIIMAAAVSDYTPVKTEGKISSDQDELIIRMVRTPKILAELRDKFGSETFIVGFKLLSGSTRVKLIQVARKQLVDNRLNLVVANDLSRIKNGMHPIIIITPEGGTIDIDGTSIEVAGQLAKFIHNRVSATHYHGVAGGISELVIPKNTASHTYYGNILKTAQAFNLFTDQSGFVSAHHGIMALASTSLWISPRQVDKSTMTIDDAIYARVVDDNVVLYAGNRKPSTDTGVLAALYNSPSLTACAFLHFHNGWGRMKYQTSFPYPCGTREEYNEIIQSFSHEKDKLGAISVELIHHGFLLGFIDPQKLAELKNWWYQIQRDFFHHAKEVLAKAGKTIAYITFDPKKFRPIWDGLYIAGLIYDDPSAATVYLTRVARGKGLGKIVVGQLIARGYTVRTLEYCNVADYYEKAGFCAHQGYDGLMRLTPPQI